MALLSWIAGKIRPAGTDEPQTPSRTEVLASSGEVADSVTALGLSEIGSSPSSYSVSVQDELPKGDDATKATVSFAPPPSDSQSLSASNNSSPTIRRRVSRVPDIDLALAGGFPRLSPPTRTSGLRPLTPYPRTTTTPPVRGEQVPRDEFNEYKKEMESQLQEANTRTQEANRQLLEQQHKYEREKLNWQQQLDSLKTSPPRSSTSVQQQTPPSEWRDLTVHVDTRGDENLGAIQAGTSWPSSRVNLPFKLRKLSTELVLARAEACMILREWDEMERRSQEACTMASVLHYEPLTARCHFFLGVALYGQKNWTFASDAFDFAEPSVGVYITARELDKWRQKVDTAMGDSSAYSIESMSNSTSRKRTRRAYKKEWEDLGNISSASSSYGTSVHSVERVSNIGRENTEDISSGSSTPEVTVDPFCSPEDSPVRYERSPRLRRKWHLPRSPPTSSTPTHGDRSSSPSDPPSSATFPKEFPIASNSDRLVRRPAPFPPWWHSARPVDTQGRKRAFEYLGRNTPPQPLTRGPPLTLAIPEISIPGRPRRSRLYTPGADHAYPTHPLRQGPRLRLIIPVKQSSGPRPRPTSPVNLRPARIYMPDKPDVILYPQMPFRQGKRLKLTIPSPRTQSIPAQFELRSRSSSSTSYQPIGYHSMPTHSPVLPPPTPPPFSNSTSSSSEIFPPFSFNPIKSIDSSNRRRQEILGRTQGLRVVNNVSESSPDELTRYIEELSQPIHTQRLRVVNHTSTSPDSTSSAHDSSPEEPSRHTHESAVPGRPRISNRTTPSTPDDSPDKPYQLPNRSQGLRVINRSSTSSSSPDKPYQLPNRSQGLRVINHSSTSSSSPDKPYQLPNRSQGLRVINRFSASSSSPDKPSQLPNRTRGLRVINRTSSTPDSSPNKRPPLPPRPRPRLRVINRTSSTPESTLDKPPHELDLDSRGRSRSTGEAIWFPVTGSGNPRFFQSPDDHPDGLFVWDSIHPNVAEDNDNEAESNDTEAQGNNTEEEDIDTDAEDNDRETGIAIEIGASVSQGGSIRQDIRKMVWRPPSRDSTRLVRLLGLGITVPISTLRRGLRVSRRDRSRTPNDDQLWDDYIEELGDRGRLAPSGIEHIRRSRSGDLGSSRSDERMEYANTRGRTLSSNDILWLDAIRHHEEYAREEREYQDEQARHGSDVSRASSTPDSRPNKPPPLPAHSRLRVVNRSSSTPESSLDEPPPEQQQDSDSPDRWGSPIFAAMQPQGRVTEESSQTSDETENMAFVGSLGLPTTTLRRGLRVSRRERNRKPEDNHLWDDYIEETGDEDRVAHSGIERIQRSQSGDLGGSRSNGRRQNANARTRSLSSDDSLLFDARRRHEGYPGEGEEHQDDQAREEYGDGGPDRIGRSRSHGTTANRSERSDGNGSPSTGQGKGSGGWQGGDGDLDLTLYE